MSNTDADATVTLEDMVDFIGAKAFVIISINSKDKAPDKNLLRETREREENKNACSKCFY